MNTASRASASPLFAARITSLSTGRTVAHRRGPRLALGTGLTPKISCRLARSTKEDNLHVPASESSISSDMAAVLRMVQDQHEGREPTPSRWQELDRSVWKAYHLHLEFGRDLMKIGRFDAIRARGEGGYGVVFEARDPVLGRHVALKLCLTSGPEAAAALMDEAKLLAKLSHPNIIPVYEPGRHGEDVFFAMELILGPSADEFVNDVPRPSWEEIVDIYRGVGRGLAAAHDAGIVHGDLKPSNILIDESGRPRVSDFGLARLLREHEPEPELGSPKPQHGTLAYMAPEVLRREAAGLLSDQWSFCVTLWEALEGLLPFDVRSLEILLDATMYAEPETAGEVPEQVRAVIRRGLSPEAGDRYADMHELLAELDKLREPPFPLTDPDEVELVPEPPTGAGLSSSHRPWASALIGGLLFGAGVFAAMSYSHLSQPLASATTEQTRGAPRPADTAEESPPAKGTPGIVGDVPIEPDTSVRPEPAASATTEQADDAEESPPAKGTICVVGDVPIEPDTSVQAVCRTLGVDGYQASGDLWDELVNSREQKAKSPQEWLKLACDTTVVAQTFLREADTASPKQAVQLRAVGKRLARHAKGYLSTVTNKETAGAVSQVRPVIDGIINTE